MIIFENVDDLQLKKKYIVSLNMFLEMIFFWLIMFLEIKFFWLNMHLEINLFWLGLHKLLSSWGCTQGPLPPNLFGGPCVGPRLNPDLWRPSQDTLMKCF